MNDAGKRCSPGSDDLPFQNRVVNWLMECFSMEICRDGTERNHRFLEEALELVQALGCTRSEARQLVDYVFDRPAGEPMQELGGVQVTLAALCFPHDLDMKEAAERELARVWTKIDKIRAKQAAKPKHSPLPQHVDIAQASADPVVWIVLADETGNTRIWWRDKELADVWCAKHDMTAIPLYASPPAISGDAQETDEQFEKRLAKQEASDNLRLLDYIADKIGLPHNEELSQEKFNAWFATISGDAVREALEAVKRWASSKCPCENELPDPCPLCDARASKDKCMAIEGIIPRKILDLIETALAARPLERVAGEEIGQHIAWLFQYVQGMKASNWRDMRDNAERQLEQLSLILNAMASPLSSRPIETGHPLERLWKAIKVSTTDESFWIAEILLNEITKETGYSGSAVSSTHSEGGK